MNLTIERLNGTVYNLDELGIKTRDFIISSPSYRHRTEEAEGRPGVIDMGSVLDSRSLRGVFYAKAVDFEDYALMRDEVFRLFRSEEAFYLIESRNPGKRWLVKADSSYELDQQRLIGLFNVDFIAYEGWAESKGTTSDPLTFDAELWQIGQGLTTEEVSYTHTSNLFNIYNAGDFTLNPRFMDLIIEYKGASTNLTIKNETTGDEWEFTGTSNSGDTIKLDGVRSEKNGLSIFRDTNKKLITLNPGWNGFRLTGTSGSFEIKFNFRFYYI